MRIRNLDAETHHRAKSLALERKQSLNDLIVKIIKSGVRAIKNDAKKTKMK